MSLEPVHIDFAARGVQEVMRAFDSIEQRMVRLERAGAAESRRGSRERIETTKRETSERERSVRKQADTQEKESKRGAAAVMREQQKAQQAEIRATEKKANEVKRIEERLAQWKERVHIRSSEMAGRFAAKEVSNEIRERKRAEAEATRSSAAMGRRASGIGANVLERGRGILGMAGATLGIGGGFLLADVARQQLDAQKQAALLVNTVTTGSAPPAGASVGNILAQAGQVSSELGVDKGALIGASLEYSRKARGGDFAGAMGNMAFFGKMAKVTGADINEVAGAAGILQSQNQDLKAPEMQQMLLDVYAQGKQGSMSMVDVAKQIGVLGSPATSFAGDQATNQRKLLGLGQLAAPQGTIEEAGTFIKDLVSEAASHRKSTRSKVGTEAMGVKFDKFGRMESPEQMIEAVMNYTKGDVTKIEDVFGKRGTPLFRSLLKPYTDAGGGDAGMAAVRQTMSSVTGATMTAESLNQQNAVIDSTDAQKLQSAVTSIENTLSTALAPALSKFASAIKDHQGDIEGFLRGVGEVANYFLGHPFEGIGALVLGSIVKDLAGAGIGMAVKAALLAMMGGGGAVPSVGGAAGSAMGALGSTVAVAGAGALGIGAGFVISDALSDKELGRQRDVFGKSANQANDALALMAHTRQGTVTPAEIAQVEKEAAETQKEITKRQRAEVISGHPMLPQDRVELKNLQATVNLLVDALGGAAKKIRATQIPTGSATADNPARNGPMPSRGDPRHV